MYTSVIKVQATGYLSRSERKSVMNTSSVKTLVRISYALFALAGLFGVAAVIGGHSNAFMTGLLGLAGVLVYARAERIAAK
jgi:hypothetical protein